MIHITYIYFIINSFIVGVYLSDQFNDDSLLKKQLFSLVLFLFGGILVAYELIIADKVLRWWYSSEIVF